MPVWFALIGIVAIIGFGLMPIWYDRHARRLREIECWIDQMAEIDEGDK